MTADRPNPDPPEVRGTAERPEGLDAQSILQPFGIEIPEIDPEILDGLRKVRAGEGVPSQITSRLERFLMAGGVTPIETNNLTPIEAFEKAGGIVDQRFNSYVQTVFDFAKDRVVEKGFSGEDSKGSFYISESAKESAGEQLVQALWNRVGESNGGRGLFADRVSSAVWRVEASYIHDSGVMAIEKLLEHRMLPNLEQLTSQTPELLAALDNFAQLRELPEDPDELVSKISVARDFARAVLVESASRSEINEEFVEGYGIQVKEVIERVDSEVEGQEPRQVGNFDQLGKIDEVLRVVHLSAGDRLDDAAQNLNDAAKIIANEFIEANKDVAEVTAVPVLADPSEEGIPADGSVSDRTADQVSDSGSGDESSPVDPEAAVPPTPDQSERNGGRRGRGRIRGFAGRIASSRSVKAGLMGAVLGGSAVFFIDHQMNHSGSGDNGPKNVRTIGGDPFLTATAGAKSTETATPTASATATARAATATATARATSPDASATPSAQTPDAKTPGVQAPGAQVPDNQAAKPSVKPDSQSPKIENSSQLTIDQAKKVLDGADGKVDGRLTVVISKARGAVTTDNLNWAGERVLEGVGAPHFNAGQPIENGGPSWRLISALIADQGKTPEDYHLVYDGDEIKLDVKERSAQAFTDLGVNLPDKALNLIKSNTPVPNAPTSADNTPVPNTPTSAEISPIPELDPALLLQLGGSSSKTVMPEGASFNSGKSNLNGSIKISGVTHQSDQTISAWEDEDKDKHPKPKPTKTPTVKPTVTVTPTLTPTPTATPVYVPPVVPVPDFDVPIPTPTASPTPRPTATPTPKPVTGLVIGKFIDANGNGKYDAGEIGTKAKINVDGPGRNDFSIETDFAGNAAVPVIPGTYIVCEEVPDQWKVTTEGFLTKPECQVIVLGEGETRGVLFGNQIKPTIEPPMPPITGLSRGDSFEAKRELSVKDADAKDKIVSLQVLRGDKVIAGTNVDLAQFGPTRAVIRGQRYDLNTWNVSLKGDFSQLDGGGTKVSDNQDQVAGHNRIDTGVNPIGEVLAASELKKVLPGDKLVKEMADGRKVVQIVRFAGEADPRAFFNPGKDSTIITTCTNDSDVENPVRFVVYAETIETTSRNSKVDLGQRYNAGVITERVSEEREISEIRAKFAVMHEEVARAQQVAIDVRADEEDSVIGSKSLLLTGAILAAGAVQVLRNRLRKINTRR